MSAKLPAPTRRALLSLLPCTMLCACLTPMPQSQIAPPCVTIVKASGLLAVTPGAVRPGNDTVGEIAAFGVRQTGQLDKANADKASAAGTLDACDAAWRDAIKQIRPKPLGIF